MGSRIGKNFVVSIFGQSHSAGIGCVIEGVPAGRSIDENELQAFLKRRAPQDMPWSTSRKEPDEPEFIGGLANGVTCGAPIAALIRNADAKPVDYENIGHIPRPGHADFVADVKFGGFQDRSGGGHFSGRMTAPLCIAGGIAKQLLREQGIIVGAHIRRIAGIDDDSWPMSRLSGEAVIAPGEKKFPVIDDAAGERMKKAILEAREAKDSVGGVVECAAVGMPIGIGEPMFDGIENAIAALCFGIPAVKGIEFGLGFEAADLRASQHNDPYRMRNGQVELQSNNAGGVLGGITTGEPIVFRVAFKPTPSIFSEQQSVDLTKRRDETLVVKGRHDPCIVIRALPVVEAACAIALYDLLLESRMDL